ncbi:MAG: TonB-dependent receptor, partial [Tannerellaceae bacterium]|nr:TonB-dependent receptor [Tannerellaceae bacterium]
IMTEKTSLKRLYQSFTCLRKTSLLLCLCFGFNFAIQAGILELQVNLSIKNTTLRDAFEEIREQTGISIVYSNEVIDDKTVVSLDEENISIEMALSLLLANENCSYRIENNQVILYPKAPVVKEAAPKQAQQSLTVKGVIKDEFGEPVIGAAVAITGTGQGTITNMDGEFTLEGVTKGTKLSISYLGYKTQVVTVDDSLLIITLQEDNVGLEEVVVVGYGVQKKVNLTGSISTVSADDLVGRTNTNLLQSIQGTSPGVTVISRPGQNPTINVRGRGNLKTSAPLYVIDGAISSEDAFVALDPNSIESVSILKDAASSAIYGSRAAYGVVLVTTKQGRSEGYRVNYNGFVGIKQETYKPKVVSSEWEARIINEAAINAGGQAQISDEVIEKYRNGSEPDLYPNTDWYGLIFDNSAVMTSHTVSFDGVAGKTSYYASLGYMYDDSFTPGQSNDRYNANLNVNSQVKPWLRVRAGARYIESKMNQDAGDISLAYLLQSPPSYVARQSNGEYGTVQGGTDASGTFVLRNPLRVLEEGGWKKWNYKMLTLDGALDFTLYKNLILTTQIISDTRDRKEKKYEAFLPAVPRFLDEGATTVGEKKDSKMEYDWKEWRRMTYNVLLNYSFTIQSHAVSALLGTSYETFNYQQQKSSRKNFPTNTMSGINGGSSAPADSEASGEMTEEKLSSYFGRVNYSYKDRYLFEVNFRADASSRFHKDSRWGYFPSLSAGWRISEEEFMQAIDWMDNLKIRGSWGQLGNINNVSQYDYFSAYGVGGDYKYAFGGNTGTGVYESKIPNASLTWETVSTTDIGLDVSVLNNKLSVSADWYLKKTDNILLDYDVIREVGAVNKVAQNLGKVENKGIEFVVTHNNQIGNVVYSVSGNISKNWNKVTYLGEGIENFAPSDQWITAVGYPIGTFYGYKTDGLLTQEDIDRGNYISNGTILSPGDVKYVDLDDSGDLSAGDRTFLGKDVPDFTYGASLYVAYRNFDLNIFGQGVSGAQVYFTMESAHPFADNAPAREWHKQRWTKENPDSKAAYPRLLPQGNANYAFNTQNYSDFWLFSANYFRIKAITLGYTFPKSTIGKLGLSNLRVYVASENPITFRGDKRMKEFDPETYSGRGYKSTGTRSFTFGVNVS